MKQISFIGYTGLTLEEVIAKYKERTGKQPTIIVAHNNDKCDFDGLVRSRFGANGMLLATHEVTADEYKNEIEYRETGTSVIAISTNPEPETENDMETARLPAGKKKLHHYDRGQVQAAICPHCKGYVEDFYKLGYWYGWEDGKYPPYWGSLTRYVFGRDDHKCASCEKKFLIKELVAHHIVPKEPPHYGTDSARNLATLCQNCHKDDKPIFEEETNDEG